MKILYTSDLHGEIHLYHELLPLSISSSSEIMIIGGDLLPSLSATKRYEDMVPNQRVFIDEFLASFLNKILETTPVQQIFLISGNWDLGYGFLFTGHKERIIDLNQKSYCLRNRYELIGYPFVPPTPFRPKDYEKMDNREAPWPPQKIPSYIRSSDQTDQLTPVDPYLFLRGRETIEEDLRRLPKPLDPKRTIYVMHSPPYGTRLDFIQGGESAGSRSIKAFIEKHLPFLTLHGHIHESPDLSGHYFDQIGETISVNPGQSVWKGKDSLSLYAVTFEIGNVPETLRHTCFG